MKVTIITATYNSAATITDTIESVLAQTYPDIEHWIIDGMSTDDTINIVKSYEQKAEGRLHWLSEKDRGIYDAMNKGIQHASGDIIGILNSDDFFTSPEVIAHIADAFARQSDLEAVYGDVHFVKNDNLHKCVRYYSGRIFRPFLIRFGFICPHPSLYVKRSTYQKFGGYNINYKIAADFELVARYFYNNHICSKYIHLDTVTMRIGGASTRNIKARLQGARESLVACKTLGIATNRFMIYLKYPIKILSSWLIRR